ncbi:MAG: hypothetical protein E7040_03595 [Lentisphaerae bacterium]|nr:hypothetical protein [Lentisphaerota bacterium]
MKKLTLLLFLLLCIGMSLQAADYKDIPVNQFVQALRSAGTGETWGRLTGSVIHRRRGSRPVAAPISFRSLFTAKAVVGQLVFRNKEVYQLTQSRLAPYSSSVETSGKSTLSDVGILPSDLVMNFIYWDFKAEEKSEKIRMQDCRVLVFESQKTKDRVKVYASATYIFPIRVEWIDKKTGKPFRTLDVNGLKKVNDLWVVSELSVSGPGWRSIVQFKKLEAGQNKNGVPSDLFIE